MIHTKLIYAILLVILVLFFILYRGVLSLQLLVFALIFPALLRILLFFQRRGIGVRICKPEYPVRRGESFEWIVRISSTCPIPAAEAALDLEYCSSMAALPQQLRLTLPVTGGEPQQLRLKFCAVTSGTMTLSVRSLTVSDMFRLFSSKVKVDQRQNFSVLPVPAELEAWEPEQSRSEDTSEFSKTKPGDDPSEIFDLHQYREGDLISRIHWKLSSKTDNLMVKEFSLPVAKQYRLIPDYRLSGRTAEAALRLDALGSLMLAVSQKLTDAQLPVLFCWLTTGRDEPAELPAAADSDANDAIGVLLSEQPAPEADQHGIRYLSELQNDEHCSDSLLFFTPQLTTAAADAIAALPHPERVTVFAVLGDEMLPDQMPFRIVAAPLTAMLPPWELDYLSGNGTFPEGGAFLQ